MENVEFATLEWVAWYNHKRLLEPLGYLPPAALEHAYYDRQAAQAVWLSSRNRASRDLARFNYVVVFVAGLLIAATIVVVEWVL